MNKFAPLHPKVNTLLHGADYNPEQWENDPDIIDKDIAMMQQAKCNVMSVGYLAGRNLSHAKGYLISPGWTILDKLYAAGIHIFTPRGARPAWMSQRYPQVLRVGRDRVPALHGGRHNHCMSSPVYREKTLKINTCWRNAIRSTRRCWAGIFPMNMAVNAIAISARTVFATG
jgi:beta-galactosidase